MYAKLRANKLHYHRTKRFTNTKRNKMHILLHNVAYIQFARLEFFYDRLGKTPVSFIRYASRFFYFQRTKTKSCWILRINLGSRRSNEPRRRQQRNYEGNIFAMCKRGGKATFLLLLYSYAIIGNLNAAKVHGATTEQ